jgi:hypothetical protein
VPAAGKNAPLIATLIVVYHHTTRMIMYYFYERIWISIHWGVIDESNGTASRMTSRDKIIWVSSMVVSVPSSSS